MTSAGGNFLSCPMEKLVKLPPADNKDFRGLFIKKFRNFYHRLGIQKDDKIVYNKFFQESKKFYNFPAK